MSICIRCNVAEKAPGAHKYCDHCKKEAERETNRITQIIRRQKHYSACHECNDKMTYTKYCTKCAQIVKLRKNRERYEEGKIKAKMCEECGVKPKWSHIGTTKYCEECKVIVQKRKIAEKNRIRDAGKARARKERKLPVQKGIRLDPTSQKPTKKVPKVKTKDGGINPYFLRRGNPTQNGCSSGMTQFNQT